MLIQVNKTLLTVRMTMVGKIISRNSERIYEVEVLIGLIIAFEECIYSRYTPLIPDKPDENEISEFSKNSEINYDAIFWLKLSSNQDLNQQSK
jgi:hypothetical protein